MGETGREVGEDVFMGSLTRNTQVGTIWITALLLQVPGQVLNGPDSQASGVSCSA